MKITCCNHDVLSIESDIVVFVRKDGKLIDVIYDCLAVRSLFRSLISTIVSRYGKDIEVYVLKVEDVNKILEVIVNEDM